MFGSLKDILEADEERGTSFWETVMEDDRREENISMEKSLAKMNEIWQAMLESDREYDEKLKSASGLTGTDAAKIGRHREDSLCSEFGSRILERALRIAESNACMKRIVAAPTAGSSGVVPAGVGNGGGSCGIPPRRYRQDDCGCSRNRALRPHGTCL